MVVLQRKKQIFLYEVSFFTRQQNVRFDQCLTIYEFLFMRTLLLAASNERGNATVLDIHEDANTSASQEGVADN